LIATETVFIFFFVSRLQSAYRRGFDLID